MQRFGHTYVHARDQLMTDEQANDMPGPKRDRGAAAPLLVAGLGASAGGIEALREFFSHVPPDTGIAYVVILHLSPEHESRLAEVLQATAAIPVAQVHEPMRLVRDHVYVISPNQILEVRNDMLVVSPMRGGQERRAPVDKFFRALAESHRTASAAVVLSGTGPNGSNGIKRVKELGGLTIAQEPSEAEFAEMPNNSIATGLVDDVLPVARIPGRIASYARRISESRPLIDPAATARGALGTAPADAQHLQDWRDVLTLLRTQTGQDFSNYKTATLRRRVERRLNVRGVGTIGEYAALMRSDPAEPQLLMKELLISVTNFFRDPEAFAVIERRIVPQVFAGKRADDQVRVWSVGCATGEEAYWLAMLLSEFAAATTDAPSVQVFGTDLDQQAIAVARDGIYSDVDVADVSPERLQRFFHRQADGYRVRRDLREVVLFAHHNAIKDPPFSHLDLIVCRNLLIYLNRNIQGRLLETFHFALRPGGFLFLGASEAADADLFMAVDRDAHIFESRAVTGRPLLPAAIDRTLPSLPPLARVPDPRPPSDQISPGELHLRLLEQYAPPSLVVNEEHTLLHASQSAGDFLVMTGGEPSRDVLKLVHPDLRADLRTALHLGAQERSTVDVGGIRMQRAGHERLVRIVVKPVLRDDKPARGYFLILFEQDIPQPMAVADATAVHLTSPAAEELETSREELQSVNEELTTVNQELKIKIEELGLTNNDFQNLINSTDIGTIFLDRALRVKLSTPRAQEVFNLLPSDVGRKLSDITSRVVHESLHDDVAQVLERLQTIEREVQTREGRWYLMRILPYRTTDDRIDGVAITFFDITARRSAEDRVRAGEERLRLLIDSVVDYAIFTLTPAGIVDSWNVGAERMFGYSSEEIIGKDGALLFTPEDRAAGVPEQEVAMAAASGRANDDRWHVRKDGTRFLCNGVTTRIAGTAGFVKIARDLTERQESARALDLEVARSEASHADMRSLLRRVVTAQEDERARIARDLHDQLGQQLTALRLSLEQHRDACTSGAKADVDRALEIARTIDHEVDFLAWELRPAALDDLGLAAALPRFVREWSRHYQIGANFHVPSSLEGRLSSAAETAFYRVAQEALTNVVKHAHAERVDVVLEQRGKEVVLVVEDDGVGFDATSPDLSVTGIGLAGMRERAALIGATLQVETEPGKGTSIFLRCTCETGTEVARQ